MARLHNSGELILFCRTALAIRQLVPLNKESSTALEFACGTGTLFYVGFQWYLDYANANDD